MSEGVSRRGGSLQSGVEWPTGWTAPDLDWYHRRGDPPFKMLEITVEVIPLVAGVGYRRGLPLHSGFMVVVETTFPAIGL